MSRTGLIGKRNGKREPVLIALPVFSRKKGMTLDFIQVNLRRMKVIVVRFVSIGKFTV